MMRIDELLRPPRLALLKRSGGALAEANITTVAVEPDGWTLRVDIAGIGTGSVDHTKVSGSATPPATDYLGVSMTGVGARAVTGAASNLNIRYDADVPFPSPLVSGPDLTVWARLDKPVRSGDAFAVTIAAGLVPGALAWSGTATNNSQLRNMRYVQDNYGANQKKLVALVDVMSGKLPRLSSLTPITSLPTTNPGDGSPWLDTGTKRVWLGTGAADATPRVLAGYDFTAAGDGYYAQINCQNATVRDCLFDDLVAYPVATFDNAAATALNVRFNRVPGKGKTIVTSGAQTPTSGTMAALVKSTRACPVNQHANHVEQNIGDCFHAHWGECGWNSMEDCGWDNRGDATGSKQNHTDGIIASPTAGALEIFGNYGDMRLRTGRFGYIDNAAGSITAAGSIATIKVDSVAGFAVGEYAVVAGVSTTGYNGSWPITAIDAGAKTISLQLGSSPASPGAELGSGFISSRSVTGFLGFDNPASQAFTSTPSLPANDQVNSGSEVYANFMLSPEWSYGVTCSFARSGSLSPDNRFTRGMYFHDNYFSAPASIQAGNPTTTTPLFPYLDANSQWPPDMRWVNTVDPTDGGVWGSGGKPAIGPEPADMTFAVTAGAASATGGDTITFTLRIGRYLAQYGDETLTIAQSGTGWVNPLATDIAAAISGGSWSGLSFNAGTGVLTMSLGLVGKGTGYGTDTADVYLVISRPTASAASGAHGLTLSANSAGTISGASASTTMTPGAGSYLLLGDGASKLLLGDGTSKLLLGA